MPSLSRSKSDFLDPQRGPILSPRFVIAVVLVALGIAWMAYYYVAVRVDPTAFPAARSRASPASWPTWRTGTT